MKKTTKLISGLVLSSTILLGGCGNDGVSKIEGTWLDTSTNTDFWVFSDNERLNTFESQIDGNLTPIFKGEYKIKKVIRKKDTYTVSLKRDGKNEREKDMEVEFIDKDKMRASYEGETTIFDKQRVD